MSNCSGGSSADGTGRAEGGGSSPGWGGGGSPGGKAGMAVETAKEEGTTNNDDDDAKDILKRLNSVLTELSKDLRRAKYQDAAKAFSQRVSASAAPWGPPSTWPVTGRRKTISKLRWGGCAHVQ